MKAALRATAILSSGTFVKVAAGVAVAKAWAVLVGPAGVGSLGLMQSLVGLVSILAGMGVGTGVIRLGAAALGLSDRAGADAITRAALVLSGTGAVMAALFVVLFRGPLGRALLDGSLPLGDAVWLGAAVGLTVLTATQLGVLNAHQRVGSLARATIWGSLGAAVAGVWVLWLMRAEGLVQSYVVGLFVISAASTWELKRSIVPPSKPVGLGALRAAVGRLLRFGLPFTASALVGAGVMFALPVVVLHVLDVEAVGMYRASLTVTAGYLGFLVASMAQDYYPRLSAAAEVDVGQIVNDQLRLVLLIGVPVILVAQATSVWIVPLIYAPSFAPAVRVLEWQLTGELFRFWSFGFAFVILARKSSVAFFAVEAVGGILLLGCTWGGLILNGLIGSGMGFAAAYVGYAAVVWGSVRWSSGVVVPTGTVVLMGGAVTTSLVIHALTALSPGLPGRAAALVLASLVAAGCAQALWRTVRRSGVREDSTSPDSPKLNDGLA